MNNPLALEPDNQKKSADALRAVLRTQRDRIAAVRLDSPPGAGKTWVAERLSMQSWEGMAERVMLVTQTNQQALDLARRIACNFSHAPVTLFVRDGLPIPRHILDLPAIQAISDERRLPAGPSIVIGNGAKWSWVKDDRTRFDLQIVDEAFQLPDYRFHLLSGMADRTVLVGDPGQIGAITACDIDRWRCEKDGPHVPCPQALLARHPDILRLKLPMTRRLPPDSVRYIRSAFYADLPFEAMAQPGERGMAFAVRGHAPLDRPLDALADGASLVLAELPPGLTGEQDDEMAQVIADLVQRVLERRARVFDHGRETVLRPDMIGVVCAHVSQVSAIQERLPRTCASVLVETSDRFQGLERALIFVHHPLSGRGQIGEFHLNAGRLCVMATRHRIGCVMVARAGIEQMLMHNIPDTGRILELDTDVEFEGWEAHMRLVQHLTTDGRVYPVR